MLKNLELRTKLLKNLDFKTIFKFKVMKLQLDTKNLS